MHFIGMQNVKLAWQTIILLAAITERLHAGEGNPDRVSVMTVRREGLADEIGLQALYSLTPEPMEMRAARALPSRPTSARTSVQDGLRRPAIGSFPSRKS